MKLSSILLSLSCLMTASTFAASTDITKVIKQPLQSATVSPLCPMGAMCITGGSQVALAFIVPCAAELGPLSTKVITDAEGNSKLFVSAVTLITKNSLVARCFAQTWVLKDISLPNVYLNQEDIIDLNQGE